MTPKGAPYGPVLSFQGVFFYSLLRDLLVYAIFDSVHNLLQRSGTVEAVFVFPTLEPPGVIPSCECLRYTAVHRQFSF